MQCAEAICGLAVEVYTFTIKVTPLHIGKNKSRVIDGPAFDAPHVTFLFGFTLSF